MKNSIKNFKVNLGRKNLLTSANQKKVIGGNDSKGSTTFSGSGPTRTTENPDA